MAQIEGSEGSDGPSIAQLDEAWLQDRLAYEEQPDNAISLPAIARKWDEAIQGCRDDLEEADTKLRVSKKAADKAEKWPDSRKRAQIDDDEGWTWRSVKDRGQRLWDAHEAMCFRVSLGTCKGALSIVNALALAAPARGFTAPFCTIHLSNASAWRLLALPSFGLAAACAVLPATS